VASRFVVTHPLDTSARWFLLTKRPQNIRDMLPTDWGEGLPNVWLGTTTENQEEANRRIPHLVAIPAAVRFLSVEPMVEPVDLTPWLMLPSHDRSAPISWIIVGGESGGGARPMHPDWVRGLRDQVARRWRQAIRQADRQ
jgi:protein gp37